MKKLFSLAIIFCFTFLSGILFMSCGKTQTFKIEMQKLGDNKDLYEVVIKNYDTKETKVDGSLYVQQDDNVRVEIHAARTGVDFSELKVELQGIEKQVIESGQYTAIEGGLYYGYFLLPRVEKDISMTFEGAKLQKLKFRFEGELLNNAQNAEKMRLAQIDISETNQPKYVNLYNFLAGDQSKEVSNTFRDSEDSLERSFKIKFTGVDPVAISEADCFKFRFSEEEQWQSVQSCMLKEGVYHVTVGSIEDAQICYVKIGFANAEFSQYEIVAPQANRSYAVETVQSETTFKQPATIKVTHLLDYAVANYSDVEVYANDLKLAKVEGSETENEDGNVECEYLLPSENTPKWTGGEDDYVIRVEGIKYVGNVFGVSVTSEEATATNIINSQLYQLDSYGTRQDVLGVDSEGKPVVLASETVALAWSYPYDEILQGYTSRYDLYDIDLYDGETKVLNIKSCLGNSTENIETTLANGYKFFATYNAASERFDEFRIEFICTADKNFVFKNFKPYSKISSISWDFDDERISKIEFAILNTINEEMTEWTLLERASTSVKSVTSTDAIVVRIEGSEQFERYEIEVEGQPVVKEEGRYNVEIVDDKVYTTFVFAISELQYTNADFKIKLISYL